VRPFDANGNFHPDTGGMSELRRRAVRGAGVTVFSQGVSLAVHIVATVILARLLLPADFGVVAMVAAFSLLLTSFAGFTEAVLQRSEMDRLLASNLFWISISIGVFLTIGFAVSGPLMVRFYGDPRVVWIAVALSFQIFLSSTSILHLALLKRAMRFSLVSANDIVARTAAVVVSVSLAFAGWGYWALVAGVLAYPLSRSIGAWYLCRWVPSLPRRAEGTVAAMRFAINVYGRFSIEYLAQNMDNVLVGWRFGAQPLGFYKKAYDLFALPANQLVRPLSDVAVSGLSRLKENPDQYKRYFLRALAVTALVGMGIGANLTLVGHDVIRLLLGPRWAQSGRIFTLLGPGIGLMFLYATHGWIHLSIGTADRFFRWGILELTVTGLLFILGLPWGPEGIAAAWTVSFGILTIPAFWYAGKPIQFGAAPLVATVWKYVLASALAGSVSALLIHTLQPFATVSGSLGAFMRIAVDSTLFMALYLAGVVLLHGGLTPLNRVGRLLREMVLSQGLQKPAPAGAGIVRPASPVVFTLPKEENSAAAGR
jgi:polysaccharide transporter, PST family